MKFPKRILIITLLILFVLRPGFGTIITLSNIDNEGSRYGLIYSGVRFDFRAAFNERYMQHIPYGKLVCLIDIPASLFSDTIVLPVTVIIEIHKFMVTRNEPKKAG